MTRIERKTTVTLNGSSINVGELREILAEFSNEAIIRIRYSAGDPRDPRESDQVYLEVTHPAPKKPTGSQPIYAPGTR